MDIASLTSKQRNFARYAWAVLIFNLFVIIWGGFVSASGSGDGCGTDWPYCGNLAATEIETSTLVEFFHRGTSGLALLSVILMLILALRRYPKGHRVRKGAAWAMFFMVTESLLGAGLVIFQWVDTNESLARAFVQPLHLINTFLLTGSIALTAWWASGYPPVKWRTNRLLTTKMGLFLLGLMVLSVFGAIASLASTLFPSDTFVEGVQKDFAENVHYLIRLRIWHPVFATIVGLYLVYLYGNVNDTAPSTQGRRLSRWVMGLFWLQYMLGGLNAFLLAPIGLQLTHLLITHVMWVLAVLWTAAALAAPVHLIESNEAIELAPQPDKP
ncbi:MAG: COX15/CtaA family protein [Anaerolineae bacterium]|nr:COX15/CtaA family protein [Anaerolineae bacterium]